MSTLSVDDLAVKKCQDRELKSIIWDASGRKGVAADGRDITYIIEFNGRDYRLSIERNGPGSACVISYQKTVADAQAIARIDLRAQPFLTPRLEPHLRWAMAAIRQMTGECDPVTREQIRAELEKREALFRKVEEEQARLGRAAR